MTKKLAYSYTDKLTEKQWKFVLEKQKGTSDKESAIKAGYSEQSASRIALKLKEHPIIKKALEEFRLESYRHNHIEKAEINARCRQIVDAHWDDPKGAGSAVKALDLMASVNGHKIQDRGEQTAPVVVNIDLGGNAPTVDITPSHKKEDDNEKAKITIDAEIIGS